MGPFLHNTGRVHNPIEHILRVDTIDRLPRILARICDSHYWLFTKPIMIHHECISRVEYINLERTLVRISFGISVLIWQNHPIACSTNVEPLRQFLVFTRLVLCEHELIQLTNLVRYTRVLTPTDILHRFAKDITLLEVHDFHGVIFHDLVIDLLTHLLNTIQDGLIPFVIIIKVIYFGAIL